MSTQKIEFNPNEDNSRMLAEPDVSNDGMVQTIDHYLINDDSQINFPSDPVASTSGEDWRNPIECSTPLDHTTTKYMPTTHGGNINISGEKENEKLYDVISSTTEYSKKYKVETTNLTIKAKKIDKNPYEGIKNLFDSILENELKDMDEHTSIGLTLSNKSYNKPLYLTMRLRSQLTTDMILKEVERVVQSNEDFFLNEPLDLQIVSAELPNGQGRRRNLGYLPFEQYCDKHTRSIIKIINDEDNLCLPRAIIAGITYLKYVKKEINYNQLRQMVRPSTLNKANINQTVAAKQLCMDADIDPETIRGDITDVEKFQKHLSAYEITVFNGIDYTGRTVPYKGNTGNMQHIDLFLGDNHYNTIKSVTGAFECDEYCRKCNQPYSHKGKHRCDGSCKRCGIHPKCEPQDGYNVLCEDCNIFFHNEDCLENHQKSTMENNLSICDTTKCCKECKQIYTMDPKIKHICGNKVCKICRKYVEKGHLCHVQKKHVPLQDSDDRVLYVFFDFESKVDENKKHIPNYCVIQHQCTRCISDINTTIENDCLKCGKRQYVIEQKEGDGLIEEFFNIIGLKATLFQKVFVFAHNGGGYDFHFIINHMIAVKKMTPTIIKNGSKIITMEYKNICFKDTLNFFGCKLASLPKMFDIQELVKGYFPHFFNTSENWTYEGLLPEEKYYGPDQMSEKEKMKFEKWYKVNKNNNFNFAVEMRNYCISDVEILRKAALKFRKLFMQLLHIDPLVASCTIASACMTGYRNNFMPLDTIGVMDFKTYRMRNNQSTLALKYIRYLEKKYEIEIQSAYRGWEMMIGNYSLDGYCANISSAKIDDFNKEEDDREEVPFIVEVHGCLFHGCPKCYSEEQRSAAIGDKGKLFTNLHHRYENTMKKMEFLRNQTLVPKPYIHEVWECEIHQMCAKSEDLSNVMMDKTLLNMIESNREPFFGGRTECFRKYYKTAPGEQIRYIDINSLYPFVNKYGTYPVGHPKVLLDEEAHNCNLDQITGIAKVKILPPKQLLYPVLPIRANKKLVFALCKTCAEIGSNINCSHTDTECEIVGTYTCVELSKALQRGYKIQQIYEVWSYVPTKFNTIDGKGGVFAEYINKFTKLKQASSGYPSTVNTEQDKIEFCRRFEEKEGIKLKPEEVQPNPGLRALSKLCLNSLWGKFGQRNDQTRTEIISQPDKFYMLLIDPEKEICSIHIVKSKSDYNNDDDVLLVTWKNVEECTVDKDFINPVLSAYVTAQARLHLLEYLEQLGNCALYCDTDSIIYIHHQGDEEIETGPYLGEMKNELEDEYGLGSYISEFVCEGPKNYCYFVVDKNGNPIVDKDGKVVIPSPKVRGITINFSTSQILNFKTMKNFVLNNGAVEPIKVAIPTKIKRKQHFNIVTEPLTKAYKPIPCKRRRIANFETVPYGWVEDEEHL